jgi:hypothetical protein
VLVGDCICDGCAGVDGDVVVGWWLVIDGGCDCMCGGCAGVGGDWSLVAIDDVGD